MAKNRGRRKERDVYVAPTLPPQEDKWEIKVVPKTRGQREYIKSIIDDPIVLCKGPAGTGKTIIAIGMALQNLLAKSPTCEKVILLRPIKEACDEHVGYLPGTMDDKMAPWVAPVVDNLLVYINHRMIKSLFDDKKIEVVPLAYARGRSFNNAFIILDEAQNCSPKQVLMVLTRLGDNSRLIINGDVDQSDSRDALTGLEDVMNRLEGMEGVANVLLDDDDIVRNPMIREILERYRN